MRVVEPVGEYVLEQRSVRFKCATPWPLPGTAVILKTAGGTRTVQNSDGEYVEEEWAYGLLVRVTYIDGEGQWVVANVNGKSRVPGFQSLIAMGGSASSKSMGTAPGG